MLQGNLLSHKFVTVNVDDLVHRLEKSILECNIFDQFFGVIMYADDIILLSSSLINLQCMIDICIQFGKKIGSFIWLLKVTLYECMTYHSHKTGYIFLTTLSLGKFKLN